MYCRTIPEHPKSNSNGLYPLHRVLVENKLGRYLQSNEHVHHIDEDKNNNNIDNLEVLTASNHGKLHKKKLDKISIECPVCCDVFHEKPHLLRLRLKRNKSGLVFCSLKCSRKYQSLNSTL